MNFAEILFILLPENSIQNLFSLLIQITYGDIDPVLKGKDYFSSLSGGFQGHIFSLQKGLAPDTFWLELGGKFSVS